MKILWCFVFYLVFNNSQMSASILQNENEVTNLLKNLMQRMEAIEKLVDKNIEKNNKIHEENKASYASSFEQNQQKLGALENLVEEKDGRINKRFEALQKLVEEIKASDTSSFEQNQQKLGALENLVEEKDRRINKRLGVLEKFHKITIGKVDCREKCAKDDSCTAVFWSNSSDSECRFNQNKSTLVKFVPGELYYCKDCQTTPDLVYEAEYSGVIKLANVATNKTTQASSYANAMSDPSKAVDGDLNTWFTSEAFMTKGEPWLMVDLGQQFLVAQIRIQVRKPIHRTTGGYFKVCLIDAFDGEVNPCNQHSEILKVNRRLIGYSNLFKVKQVKMGRYVVIKKLEENVLEIAELDVMSVVPIQSYECNSCLAESNTVCDESRIPPVCSCAENNLPVDGDARNGCKDPCLDFKEDNAVCARVDHETRSCFCNAGYHPVNGDACNGCNVCPSSLGYKSYRDFGCLKAHDSSTKKWEDARSFCKSEGGDLFSPGDKLPILPKDEMNLGSNWYYWIGAKKRGNGPYEKVNSGGKLADDSQLWDSREPDRKSDCVLYLSGLLYDYVCHATLYFVCQIS